MSTIMEALARRIPERRQEIKDLVSEHGDTVISEVTMKQAYGGMRGIKGLVCDTSRTLEESLEERFPHTENNEVWA